MGIKNQGDDNFNNSGNNNDFRKYEKHYHNQPRSLNRSYLFDFCIEFSKKDLSPENEYDISITSNIEDKMDFNDLDLFKDFFIGCSHYIEDVETILEDIPNRELLIKNINSIYKNTKKFKQWDDKDHLCHLVFESLYEKLSTNVRSYDMIEEEAVEAIYAIMYYAFTKCKILDPII
ncbi:ABC-three component system protein [Tenuibacillus multivorans]|uniref:ABC-three component systems C-terminal domain-containing protein n=1 Tax=Tenuibacillus multivorans TaxID=237069 RepID=A0A1H0DG20_9BACI|nr:ABC-three component system protein [Tenuibacillus multivorans]GEL76564.1 hypothetical protein TMU01_07990 [Tenuibacillus multivorans]SDN69207.1 hypothetical protein SAMN05216498_2861 [Tenuibacillus multivorans]